MKTSKLLPHKGFPRDWGWIPTGLWLLVIAAFFAIGCQSDSSGGGPKLDDDATIFAADFSAGATGDWFTEADDLGQAGVMNEIMIIEIGQPNTIQYTELQKPSFGDFVLEVDVTQLAGDLESSFGVLFRKRSPNEFYRFEITGNGLYVIERRNSDGTWTRFHDDWLSAGEIKTGHNETNRLRVAASGPQLTFYVNDRLIQQVSDQAYTSGTIALSGGTFGQPGLSVAFDNLVVSRP